MNGAPQTDTVPLTPDLVGFTLGPFDVSWDADDVVLYALGIGARPDRELALLYEGLGPVVFPTFAAIPGMAFVDPLMATVEANWVASVHGAQRIEIVRDRIPASTRAETTAEIVDVWDKGSAAVFVVEAETSDADGALFRVRATLFVPGSGGFGGERGPRGAGAIDTPAGRPDAEIALETRPEQAAIYRLSGDRNPLHIDPGAARDLDFDRPILHGLCTFGFAARAVVAGAAGGDATRLRACGGRFTSPAYAGEAVTTRIWHDTGDVVRYEAHNDRGDVVFANGVAHIADAATGG